MFLGFVSFGNILMCVYSFVIDDCFVVVFIIIKVVEIFFWYVGSMNELR